MFRGNHTLNEESNYAKSKGDTRKKKRYKYLRNVCDSRRNIVKNAYNTLSKKHHATIEKINHLTIVEARIMVYGFLIDIHDEYFLFQTNKNPEDIINEIVNSTGNMTKATFETLLVEVKEYLEIRKKRIKQYPLAIDIINGVECDIGLQKVVRCTLHPIFDCCIVTPNIELDILIAEAMLFCEFHTVRDFYDLMFIQNTRCSFWYHARNGIWELLCNESEFMTDSFVSFRKKVMKFSMEISKSTNIKDQTLCTKILKLCFYLNRWKTKESVWNALSQIVLKSYCKEVKIPLQEELPSGTLNLI